MIPPIPESVGGGTKLGDAVAVGAVGLATGTAGAAPKYVTLNVASPPVTIRLTPEKIPQTWTTSPATNRACVLVEKDATVSTPTGTCAYPSLVVPLLVAWNQIEPPAFTMVLRPSTTRT